MIAYVDVHRRRYGVEPICRTLRASLDCGFLTPRAYWRAKARAASRMRARHEALARDIAAIHAHRFMAVYGYRKMHALLIRQGWTGIGRDLLLSLARRVAYAREVHPRFGGFASVLDEVHELQLAANQFEVDGDPRRMREEALDVMATCIRLC